MENKKKKILIISLIVIILIIIAISIVLIIKFNNSKKKDEIYSSNTIIIQNKEGLYAIFDEKGNKLTEFKFSKVEEFINNVSIVQIEEEKNVVKYGIIDNKGKMIVDFEQYKYITRQGCLFEVTDNEYNKYLLDANGKILFEVKNRKLGINKEVHTYTDVDEILVLEEDKTISVLDYKGNIIVEVEKKDSNSKFEILGNTDYGNPYVVFYYNNKNYILNVKDGKLVKTLESTGSCQVTSYNPINSEQYILSFYDDSNKVKYQQILQNDKVLYESNEENYSATSMMYFSSNGIIHNDKYIMDSNGKVLLERNSNQEIIDVKNYIESTTGSSTGATIFYVDGKEIKRVQSLKPAGVASYDKKLYVLKKSVIGTRDSYMYYKVDGETLNNVKYDYATAFNDNGLAIVRENKDSKQYIIDTNGNKVSKEYDSIKELIIGINGGKYSGGTFYKLNETKIKGYSLYEVKDGSYNYLLNSKGEEVIKTNGAINLYENYFTVNENNSTKYYTLEGKVFYEE